MSEYGLRITNPFDFSKFVFNEKTAPAYIVWAGIITPDTPGIWGQKWNTWWKCPTPIPPGHDYAISSHTLGEINWRDDGPASYPNGGKDLSVTYDNQGYLTFYWDEFLSKGKNHFTKYIVVIAWPEMSGGQYGLRISGNNNFSSLNSVGKYSYVSHKKELMLSGEFNLGVIDNRLNLNNCLPFFYTEDNNAFVALSIYRGYELTPKVTLEVRNPKSADMTSGKFKVVIFSNLNFDNNLRNDKYGLRIRDDSNNIRFSSAVGVLTRPVSASLNGRVEGDKVAIPGIVRPMYTPCNFGESIYKRNNKVIAVGGIDGKYITPCISKNIKVQRGYYGNYTYISSIKSLYIDAETYFNF
ncbi:hypothetical protein Ppb6_01161 [Photorhabdus australis subsp. thailandensis]|uniref:Uncharacterized protein n=1 Tax=Photorhabdus australis subsp. thailandensis TaxID=2805096 RepID=A0A1C0U6M2_9GAMM|nr:hypothetical protein [Photorhabdus australis]OCQ53535.1 hypothetical protein Ppb6_01161 [Photorhabdus australis subsp. thailandensis]